MAKLQQAPDRSQNARNLAARSVLGQKIDFVQNSNVAVGVLTLTAGNFGGFTITLNVTLDGVIYGFNNVVGWHYSNIFVDNNNDFNYELDDGGSLSDDQLEVNLRGPRNVLTPTANRAQEIQYRFKNSGVSTHVIYLHSFWKFIVSGDILN